MSEPLTDEERAKFSAACRAEGLRVEVLERAASTGLHTCIAWPLFSKVPGKQRTITITQSAIRSIAPYAIRAFKKLHDDASIVNGLELELYTYASAIGKDAATPPQVGDAREVCWSPYKVAQVGLNANDFASGWITLRLERVGTKEQAR